jgi:hypothetical protein
VFWEVAGIPSIPSKGFCGKSSSENADAGDGDPRIRNAQGISHN